MPEVYNKKNKKSLREVAIEELGFDAGERWLKIFQEQSELLKEGKKTQIDTNP